MKHLRSNLILLVLSLAICCVAYPAILLATGRVLFPAAAAGSLVAENGAVRGSVLIAQRFTGDEYFWPRPSAASYNAAASAGSNWGASNPKLRGRVCQQLGPLVAYKAGSKSAGSDSANRRTPQQDMVAWYAAIAEENPTLEPTAIPAAVFDRWLSDPANANKAADLESVAADMIMASGSGLDPHISLRNALSVYQLDRIARKRTPPDGDWLRTRTEIAESVAASAFSPLGGLVGEPLVNVLELNLDLDRRWPLSTARMLP